MMHLCKKKNRLTSKMKSVPKFFSKLISAEDKQFECQEKGVDVSNS